MPNDNLVHIVTNTVALLAHILTLRAIMASDWDPVYLLAGVL